MSWSVTTPIVAEVVIRIGVDSRFAWVSEQSHTHTHLEALGQLNLPFVAIGEQFLFVVQQLVLWTGDINLFERRQYVS